MMKRLESSLPYLFAGALLLSLFSCQKSSDLPLEAGFGGASTAGTLYERILPPTEILQVRTELNCGRSNYIFLGRRHGLEAKALMLFDVLPDSSVVQVASIRFVIAYHYGAGALEVEVHPVVSDWDEYETTWSTFPPVDEGAEIGRTTWAESDSYQVEVALDTSAVNEWIRNPQANHGIELRSNPEADLLFRLYSVETLDPDLSPYLWLRYTKNGVLDSARVFPSADLFVARWGDQPTQASYLVSALVGERVLLKFDLSSIPQNATINRAQFEWSLAPEDTWFEDATLALSLHRSQIWPWDATNVAYDTSSSYATFYTSGNDTLLTFTSVDEIRKMSLLLQRLIMGQLPDNGFVLRVSHEDVNFGRVGLVSANSDTAVGPRLIVTFTLPPPAGFP